MHAQEWETPAECADCKSEIWEGSDPSFPFAENAVLCFTCALRRGGRYDSGHEIWVVVPDLNGLTQEVAAA